MFLKIIFLNFFLIYLFAGHRCNVKGCGNVLILDGNMKNA